MSSAREVLLELQSHSDGNRARDLARFFQTGPGQYGEGDLFFGIRVPETRKVAAKYLDLSFTELQKLLDSAFHEARLCALVILTKQVQRSKDQTFKKRAYVFYVKNVKSRRVNNWDLIDIAAPIIGIYLLDVEDPITPLLRYSKSKNLWERRLSIMLTFTFIRAGEFEPTLILSEALLHDQHDLIHKAVGWMLREVGNRSPRTLRGFLEENYQQMSRTALRYAIEKFPESERKKWLTRR